MREHGKISIQQITILVIFTTIGDSILFLPSMMTTAAKQDSWLSVLLGIPIGLFILWLMLRLSRMEARSTLFQMNQKLLGQFFGGILSVLFLMFFLVLTSGMLREISDFITTIILPQTPLYVIHFMMIIVMLFGIKLGLEPLARASEIFFPWFLLFFFSLVLLLLPQIQLTNMLPILGSGIGPVLHGMLYSVAFPFSELLVFLVIIPYVNEGTHLQRDLLLGSLFGGMIIFILVLLSTLVLGPTMTSFHIYPSYSLAKKISIGHFLERLEAMLAIIWIFSIFFKTVLYYYATVLGTAQLFRLKDYRMLAAPIGFILFGLAFYFSPNYSYLTEITAKYWPFWDYTYIAAIVLLLLVSYLVKKNKQKAPSAPES
ncbi:endospore germination permease [Paenibacillus sepulcri]|uniref:Spore germination protein n=1 Tax=Paenibacillus sepulcri TaxID=359917 RepID=A0ABS7BY05_9BACL|nr:spore germination protein [Paenibacillus sepulcri]